MKDKTYNGHKTWDYWNVSLWINNDEGLYRTALFYARQRHNKRKAAQDMLDYLEENNITSTPDGARYTVPRIMAAMQEM